MNKDLICTHLTTFCVLIFLKRESSWCIVLSSFRASSLLPFLAGRSCEYETPPKPFNGNVVGQISACRQSHVRLDAAPHATYCDRIAQYVFSIRLITAAYLKSPLNAVIRSSSPLSLTLRSSLPSLALAQQLLSSLFKHALWWYWCCSRC